MNKIAVATFSSMICGAAGGAAAAGKIFIKKNKKAVQMSDKHLALYMTMLQWVKVKQEGRNLAEYFIREGYRNIAVYGMGYVGERLVEELAGTDVAIRYGIDANADNVYAQIPVVKPSDCLEHVDAVVVTPVYFFDQIEAALVEKVSCPVLSVDDVLFDL